MTDRLSLAAMTGWDFQSMPVGESVRCEHAGCGPKNASCTRTPVGWLMYCYKCGSKGLQVARVASNSTYHTRVSEHDPAAAPVQREPVTTTGDYTDILKPLGLLPHHATNYNLLKTVGNNSRLWFPLCYLRRDIEGVIRLNIAGYAGKLVRSATPQARKWFIDSDVVKLHPKDEIELVYMTYAPYVRMKSTNMVVVVEDPISALKIDDASPNTMAIAMLGLRIGPMLLESLGRMNYPVVLWVDGDLPGIRRGAELYKQLKFLRGGKHTYLHYVIDKDPKDLTPAEIKETLDSFRKEVSTGSFDMEEVSAAHS